MNDFGRFQKGHFAEVLFGNESAGDGWLAADVTPNVILNVAAAHLTQVVDVIAVVIEPGAGPPERHGVNEVRRKLAAVDF